MDRATYYAAYKGRGIDTLRPYKYSWLSLLRVARFNHPNRLHSITINGTVSYTDDETQYERNADAEEGDKATVYQYDVDNIGALGAYTRILVENDPVLESFVNDPFTEPTGPLKQPGDFMMLSPTFSNLSAEIGVAEYQDPVVVGTKTTTPMEYVAEAWGPTEEGPTAEDITCRTSLTTAVSGNGQTDTELQVVFHFGGASGFPNVFAAFAANDPLEAWSGSYPAGDDLADEIARRNDLDGGGHSASSSLGISLVT
jgi:hypothetical protein